MSREGLEPSTHGLKVRCSTNWANDSIWRIQGSNLWPPACKADALPAELILHIEHGSFLSSQAVAHQLLSALRSLTSVFGMGTGVSFLLSPPYSFELLHSKLNIISRKKPSPDRLAFGQVLDWLVLVRSILHRTSTPSLSTSSSLRCLTAYAKEISSWGGLRT